MRIGRTLPPAATRIGFSDIALGICGMFRGPRTSERFRSELTDYFGVRHCFLVSSGAAALTLILLSLKELFPDRDEVVVPAFTCYSVPASVLRAALRIKLCDLDADNLDFDLAKMSVLLSGIPTGRHEALHPSNCGTASAGHGSSEPAPSGGQANRTLAVLPTHLFGYPADVLALRNVTKSEKITIVEDAAQAMGGELGGAKLGTLGDVSFFSLGRGKAFTTVEGGVILTDRDDIAQILDRRVRELPSYNFLQQSALVAKSAAIMVFVNPIFFWIPHALPFLRLGVTIFEPDFPIRKMSSFQAGLGIDWRHKLMKLGETRRQNSKKWIEILSAFSDKSLLFQSTQLMGLIRFPIRVRDPEKRKEILRESAERGAGIMPSYPHALSDLEELGLEARNHEFPIAESFANELITLPTHSYLCSRDVKTIKQILSRALHKQGGGTQ